MDKVQTRTETTSLVYDDQVWGGVSRSAWNWIAPKLKAGALSWVVPLTSLSSDALAKPPATLAIVALDARCGWYWSRLPPPA